MQNVKDISKVWDRLTDAERDAFVKQYDRPIPKSETRPLTKAERERYERAIGRKPRKAASKTKRQTQRLFITLERGLVADLDAHARKLGLSRSELIARGLAMAIGRRAG
jgi:hypothetical protein